MDTLTLEQNISALLFNSQVAVAVYSENGECILANNAAADIAGTRLDEYLEVNFNDFDSWKITGLLQNAKEVLSEGTLKTAEVDLTSKFGRKVFINSTMTRYYSEGQKYLLHIYHDITELRTSEELLRRSEKRFRDIAKASSDWLWEMGSDLRYTYFSRSVGDSSTIEKVFGLGQSHKELPGVDHASPNWRQHFDDLDHRRPFRNFLYQLHCPNGTSQALSISGIPVFDNNGEFEGYRGTISDITRQVEAENSRFETQRVLAQLLQNTEEGYWRVDNDRRTVDVNPAMCRIMGRKREDIIGRKGTDFFDEENDRLTRYHLQRRKQGISEPYEVSILRPDGTNIPCLNNATPIHDEQGNKIGSIGLWTDLSDRKRLEKAETKRQAAELANQAKSDFLATMSHDLRTPLNAIIGFSEMMQSKMFGALGDPHYDEYAKDIYDAGTHLLSLINDILDLSKIEAGKYELADEEIDLQSHLSACLRQLSGLAEKSRLNLAGDIPSDLPALRGDERAVIQIVNNLVSNAIKFTPEGGDILVSADVSEVNGIMVSVKDSGVGLTTADAKKVLNPFEQVENQMSSQHRGTGLGLPICARLMQMMEGDLEIESTVGQGTTVTLHFPPKRSIFPN